MSDNNQSLLEVRNLAVEFHTDEGIVHAVNGISYQISKGKTLALVGESGCGKSVSTQAILRLLPKTSRITSGEIIFQRPEGPVDILKLGLKDPQLFKIRGQEISIIFQEPMTSFSPVHTIGQQIAEVILVHEDITSQEARERVIHLLARVGIPNPGQTYDNYPFGLSGGMRQRAMIAMALACRPSLIIADEPTTAVDVTIQAQILGLLKELQAEFGVSLLLITHNFGVVAQLADRVAVMYLGHIVEEAPVKEIFSNPYHPYTKALLKSLPMLGRKAINKRLASISGTVPNPYEKVVGCAFHTRCEVAFAPCSITEPQGFFHRPEHWVCCHQFHSEVRK